MQSRLRLPSKRKRRDDRGKKPESKRVQGFGVGLGVIGVVGDDASGGVAPRTHDEVHEESRRAQHRAVERALRLLPPRAWPRMPRFVCAARGTHGRLPLRPSMPSRPQALEEVLKELGVSSMGQRMKICNAVAPLA